MTPGAPNSPASRSDRAEFGPDRRWALAAAIGTAVAVGVVLLSDDPQQEILAFLAAIVLATFAALDLYFNPRLVVDARGLTLRTPTVRATLPWLDRPIVRIDSRTRLGLASHTLEIDTGELLVVLSRHALGADPEPVNARVQALRPADDR